MTVTEIIASLEHSTLPSVIVEGDDDIIVYREIENYIKHTIDVLNVGGRDKVLQIYDEISNRPGLQNKTLIFIADQDTWCNTGVPADYQSEILIFTTGYSLENDVFVDFGCQQIIDKHQNKDKFFDEKDKYLHWYALALQATLKNKREREVSNQASQIPEDRQLSRPLKNILHPNYQQLVSLKEDETYPNQLKQNLKDGFPFSIRGKALLELFIRSCKYHHSKAMFEQVAIKRGDHIERIFREVENIFGL